MRKPTMGPIDRSTPAGALSYALYLLTTLMLKGSK